jgi:hypothetical protein
MKKIILIIEDRTEEQSLAKRAVIESGNTPMLTGNLEDGIRLLTQLSAVIFGVVTDLHYQSRLMSDADADKPNGLAIVALCVEKNIRVGICSDINHHFSEYLKVPVKVLASHQSYSYGKIPFSEDSKNWNSIVTQVINL